MAYEQYFTEKWLAIYRRIVNRHYFYDESLQLEVFEFVVESLTRELKKASEEQRVLKERDVIWRAKQRTKDYYRDKIVGKKKLPGFLEEYFFSRKDFAWKFFTWFCEEQLSVHQLKKQLHLVFQRVIPADEVQGLCYRLKQNDACNKANNRVHHHDAELFDDGHYDSGQNEKGYYYDRKLLLSIVVGETNADSITENLPRWVKDLKLTDDELIVLRFRFGGNKEHTWEEIENFGIKSPRNKNDNALAKIRKAFEKHGIGFSDM